MHPFNFIALLFVAFINSCISSGWFGYAPYHRAMHASVSHNCKYGHHRNDDHNYDQQYDDRNYDQQYDDHNYGGPPLEFEPYDHRGCACLLYVRSTLVYRRENHSVWHSCTDWGLQNCTRHCQDIDENIRFRSRQEACDTIGEEISAPLYRRDQVCGVYGPYVDTWLQNDDLCCRRGRPSDACGSE